MYLEQRSKRVEATTKLDLKIDLSVSISILDTSQFYRVKQRLVVNSVIVK